ncbi:MAG TPA: hypothetical protein VII65_04550 [Acidimicrobiales bacterium]
MGIGRMFCQLTLQWWMRRRAWTAEQRQPMGADASLDGILRSSGLISVCIPRRSMLLT